MKTSFTQILKYCLAALFYFMFIFSLESFLSSETGVSFAKQSFSLIGLIIGLYAILGLIDTLCMKLKDRFPHITQATHLGMQLTSFSLSASFVICVLLRRAFNTQGLSHTLFFFMLPREIVDYFVPIETVSKSMIAAGIFTSLFVLSACALRLLLNRSSVHLENGSTSL